MELMDPIELLLTDILKQLVILTELIKDKNIER